jgi:hypothetical protein
MNGARLHAKLGGPICVFLGSIVFFAGCFGVGKPLDYLRSKLEESL